MTDGNIKGVLYGIAATLPLFAQQERGHIINVISTAGLGIVPTMGVMRPRRTQSARSLRLCFALCNRMADLSRLPPVTCYGGQEKRLAYWPLPLSGAASSAERIASTTSAVASSGDKWPTPGSTTNWVPGSAS